MSHSRQSSRRESGQAAVEAALIVPMMVFLVLGIIQLTMMHHARLMTEYAAYRAARAGIVNSGHCEYMKDAALLALLPTIGPTGPIPGRTDTLGRAILRFQTFKQLNLNQLQYFGVLPVIKMEVLNPKKSQLNSLFNQYGVYSVHSNRVRREEIDFDDVRNNTVIEANLLTVKITYFYEMRVPFANKLIHSWYVGAEYLKYVQGVQFDVKEIMGVDEFTALETLALSKGGDRAKMAGLAMFADTYVIPLVTTYSMRMQSNLMKKHVEKCAIN
jgi:hypothetical protein